MGASKETRKQAAVMLNTVKAALVYALWELTVLLAYEAIVFLKKLVPAKAGIRSRRKTGTKKSK